MMRRHTVGIACAALLALSLGACVAPLPRPPPLPPPPPIPPHAIEQPLAAPPESAATPVATPARSPWDRLRARFAMAACDDRPEVLHWARRYAAAPKRFAASLDQAMPFLLLVTDQIEQRDLPGEFALLPYLESHYQPLAAKGNRPAGMWQIMPATARATGLVITPEYDGRLDPLASSRAALDLITRYHDEFGDWRLADMAYNAGEYRVKRLIGKRDGHSLSAADLARLELSPTTHAHLDKLMALACIIDDPARFGVSLPDPDPGDILQTVQLGTGMDLRVAAHLAGMDRAALGHLNAGYRGERMTDPPLRLLLPADRVAQFRAAARTLPRKLWAHWHEGRLRKTDTLDSVAARFRIASSALAAANGIEDHASLAGNRLLLMPEPDAASPILPHADDDLHVHVVRAGDTLWDIARHNGVAVRELRQWNAALADNGPLRPGERIRVTAPAAD
ncbi:MAG TPA: transglycosylase SLT domain-containing protein [Rhodanobacteraceae bacterium]|nr:transglycosylase SLT domain-containing protein [Rhodanobacteraceae bacterium]